MTLTAGSALEESYRRGTDSLMTSIWNLLLAGQLPENLKQHIQTEMQHHPAAVRGLTALVDDCYATLCAELPGIEAQFERSREKRSQLENQLN